MIPHGKKNAVTAILGFDGNPNKEDEQEPQGGQDEALLAISKDAVDAAQRGDAEGFMEAMKAFFAEREAQDTDVGEDAGQ